MAAGLCYGSRGGGAQLAFHRQVDAYDTDSLIEALGELRGFLGGQKATLLWDGLPAHRSLVMRAWLRRQRHWLVVERLPGYAPELNPVEGMWSNLKGVELANLAGDTLEEVIAAAERGIQRIRATPHLPYEQERSSPQMPASAGILVSSGACAALHLCPRIRRRTVAVAGRGPHPGTEEQLAAGPRPSPRLAP